MKRNSMNLVRRNHIIEKRHSNGLIGSDSPEKAKVAKAYMMKSEKLKKRKAGFEAVINNRCNIQVNLGGVSSNMTIAEPNFKRQEKEVNVSHRWKAKKRLSSEPVQEPG